MDKGKDYAPAHCSSQRRCHLRMAHLSSHHKPRRTLVLWFRPVRRRAGASELSCDMEQNSEESAVACKAGSLRRSQRSDATHFHVSKLASAMQRQQQGFKLVQDQHIEIKIMGSCSALHFVAKTCPRKLRSSLRSCFAKYRLLRIIN